MINTGWSEQLLPISTLTPLPLLPFDSIRTSEYKGSDSFSSLATPGNTGGGAMHVIHY